MPPTARKQLPSGNRATRRTAAAARRTTGTFARLKAEGTAGQQIEPYVIEDVDPPIFIESPETAEQQLALAELFGAEGEFRIGDARRILETICGEAFPAVWELFRAERIQVLVALIQDMGRHFDEQGALDNVEEEDFPGGSSASSN